MDKRKAMEAAIESRLGTGWPWTDCQRAGALVSAGYSIDDIEWFFAVSP